MSNYLKYINIFANHSSISSVTDFSMQIYGLSQKIKTKYDTFDLPLCYSMTRMPMSSVRGKPYNRKYAQTTAVE